MGAADVFFLNVSGRRCEAKHVKQNGAWMDDIDGSLGSGVGRLEKLGGSRSCMVNEKESPKACA